MESRLDLFAWAHEASNLVGGTHYKGKSSLDWYDPAGLWETCQAAGDVQIGPFVARNFDNCSDKVAAIVGNLAGRRCNSITRDEAAAMLKRGQGLVREVPAERLGKVGRRDDYAGYGYVTGTFDSHGATIPFVVEAWANRATQPGGIVCVNRTPVCTNITVRRDQGADYAIFGCQLHHRFTAGRKDAGEFRVLVNVIAPFVPLVSSGKDPNLSHMTDEILQALAKAIRVAKRTAPNACGSRVSQKDIVGSRIVAAAERLSGDGEYLFSLRQLWYDLRPHLIEALGREPGYGTFSKIVGEYEDAHGDIDDLYRDDRGTLYHPHTREVISLGTRSVASYERPPFTFSSLLFAEKEGLFPALKHASWPEQFDCALCSSKGFATRAVRNLIRILKNSPEVLTVFVIHDADGPGTVIFETLKLALEPHHIEVVNLGLDPEEGRDMEFAVEPVNREKGRVPVADYVPDGDKEWLQENRIELNAMSTPQFIAWLTQKVTAYYRAKRLFHKVVPPDDAIRDCLVQEALAAIERDIVDEVMRKANIPDRVHKAFAKVEGKVQKAAEGLAKGMPGKLKKARSESWRSIVTEEAAKVVNGKGTQE